MTCPMLDSTWMTNTFSSFPRKIAQPLLAGRIPRTFTGTTSFFMAPPYGAPPKRQAPRSPAAKKCRAASALKRDDAHLVRALRPGQHSACEPRPETQASKPAVSPNGKSQGAGRAATPAPQIRE